MIDVKYLLKKVNGEWKKIDPKLLTEDFLDGVIIKTVSGKVFTITERKNSS